MFCYKSNAIMFEIRFSCAEADKFPSILQKFILILFVIFCGLPSLWLFGFQEKTHQFILLSLPITQTVPLMMMTLWMANIAITFPLHFVPVLDISDSFARHYRDTYWHYDNIVQKNQCNKYQVLRYMLRLLLVVMTYLVAYNVPEIGAFVGLVGSIGLSFLNFLFPIACHHALVKNNSNSRILLHILYSIVVLVAMSLGLINSYRVIQKHYGHAKTF